MENRLSPGVRLILTQYIPKEILEDLVEVLELALEQSYQNGFHTQLINLKKAVDTTGMTEQ